jgi:hypothetical protein
MSRFDYGDTVRVKSTVQTWIAIPGNGQHKGPHPGEVASVFSILDVRVLAHQAFPPGVIYGIEFGDGEAVEVHEDDLESVADDAPWQSADAR